MPNDMLRYLHIPNRDFVSFASSQTIIFMHGFGASAEDLLAIVSLLDEGRRYNWVLPMAPYLMSDPHTGAHLGYGWFPRDQRLQQQAFAGAYFSHLAEIDGGELPAGAAEIERLRTMLGIPSASLVMAGFSQGAIMSVEYLLTIAEECAGALLFSGAITARERWQRATPTALTQATPFLQTHGRADDILPITGAQAMYDLLQEKGFRGGRLITFDGGHTIPQQAIADAVTLLPRWFATAHARRTE